MNDQTTILLSVLSLLIYTFFLLLPLAPTILIFKWFPDTKITAEGPLKGLNVRATGAFAAYLVTALIGATFAHKATNVVDEALKNESNRAQTELRKLAANDNSMQKWVLEGKFQFLDLQNNSPNRSTELMGKAFSLLYPQVFKKFHTNEENIFDFRIDLCARNQSVLPTVYLGVKHTSNNKKLTYWSDSLPLPNREKWSEPEPYKIILKDVVKIRQRGAGPGPVGGKTIPDSPN